MQVAIYSSQTETVLDTLMLASEELARQFIYKFNLIMGTDTTYAKLA